MAKSLQGWPLWTTWTVERRAVMKFQIRHLSCLSLTKNFSRKGFSSNLCFEWQGWSYSQTVRWKWLTYSEVYCKFDIENFPSLVVHHTIKRSLWRIDSHGFSSKHLQISYSEECQALGWTLVRNVLAYKVFAFEIVTFGSTHPHRRPRDSA